MRTLRTLLIIAITLLCVMTISAQKPLTKPDKPQARTYASSTRGMNKAMPKYNQKYAEQMYDQLMDGGYTERQLGSKDQFVDFMGDKDNRKKMYNNLMKNKSEKYTLPSFTDYENNLSGANDGLYNFDWDTGQWGFEKQENEPISFSAPDIDTSKSQVNGAGEQWANKEEETMARRKARAMEGGDANVPTEQEKEADQLQSEPLIKVERWPLLSNQF